MAAIIKAAAAYNAMISEYAVPYSAEYFLMSSPWPIIGISIFYIYFVLKLGPDLMKNRPAFNIDRIVNVYNLAQIVLCGLVNSQILDPRLKDTTFPWFDLHIEYNDTMYGRLIMKFSYQYFLLKLLDLMDTVFFVLRKKNNQITFLHIYHHIVMMLVVWTFSKFFPGGHSSFIGYINNYVHMVMYSYYFVTSMWPQWKKNVWWKKYVTQIQMAQFALNVLHTFPLLVMREVKYPRSLAVLILSLNITMLLLFYDFYRKVYSKKKRK